MAGLQVQVNQVLEALNQNELRCTYNAIADYCGTDLRTIINCLGQRRPLASWIVNRRTLKPTNYLASQEHPNLYKNDLVIDSVGQLQALVSGKNGDRASSSPNCRQIIAGEKSFEDVLAYGVDGCKGGWLYAGLSDDSALFGTVARLLDLVEKVPLETRIFVDIPIGLRDNGGGYRLCDQQARRLLSPLRTSSVFNAPIRPITTIEDYQQANSESKRLSGKGLSKQSFNITPKIREVDQLMIFDAKARAMIREVHPEVCFYGLAGRSPMQHSKKTKEGFAERLALLARFQPGIEPEVEAALAHYPRKIVAADDILDALVCAVTARMADRWKTVPAVPEVDSKGLPMEIVYCEV